MLAIPGVVAAGRTNLGLAADQQDHPGRARPRRAGRPVDRLLQRRRRLLPDDGHRLLAGRFLGDRFAKDRMIRQRRVPEPPRAPSSPPAASTSSSIARRRSCSASPRPQAAIGKSVEGRVDGRRLVPSTIVGVVEDTRFRTARDAIEPIVYGYDPERTSQVLVRYAAARPREVMAGLARVWRKFEPEIPFEAQLRRGCRRRALRRRARPRRPVRRLSRCLAVADRLPRPVRPRRLHRPSGGPRRSASARCSARRSRDIVRLLAWQFSKPVILANLIAWPVAWWAMRDWLNTFDARIALGPGPFVLAGAPRPGHRGRHRRRPRASRSPALNPIHALRYE